MILYLRNHGYKTLAIDLDTQGNLTSYFNSEAKYDVFDLLDGKIKPIDCVEKDLIAGGARLTYVTNYFENHPLTDFANKLSALDDIYDVCIIDTPPAISKIVFAAIAASNYAIIPTEPTKDSLDGVNQTIQAINFVNESLNKNTKLLGVLLVKYKERFTVHKQFKKFAEESNEFPIFSVSIRESQAINNAKTFNKDFFAKEFAHSNAVIDYSEFTKEVIKKAEIKHKK